VGPDDLPDFGNNAGKGDADVDRLRNHVPKELNSRGSSVSMKITPEVQFGLPGRQPCNRSGLERRQLDLVVSRTETFDRGRPPSPKPHDLHRRRPGERSSGCVRTPPPQLTAPPPCSNPDESEHKTASQSSAVTPEPET
jgi:hypothetical protein